MTTPEKIQQVVEGYLSKKWRAGVIGRDDERDMPILRNTAGFSRAFSRPINDVYATKGMLLQDVSSAFGYGHFHSDSEHSTSVRRAGLDPRRYRPAYPERRKMIKELTDRLWKLRAPTANPKRRVARKARSAKRRLRPFQVESRHGMQTFSTKLAAIAHARALAARGTSARVAGPSGPLAMFSGKR